MASSPSIPPAVGAGAAGVSKARGMSVQRKGELDRYFRGLKALESFTTGKTEHLPDKAISDDFMKIAKASSFLLLYNYIEGCVLEAFLGIYAEIKQRGITYADLRVEFQRIWLEFQSKPLLQSPTTSHETYNELAAKIVSSILDRHIIEMNRKALPFSGNLDEKKIKSVCQLHGIKLSSKMQRVEDQLEIVMSIRNDLAHGSVSFAECGRDYVVADLERIKASALQYIELFLDGIDAFVSSRHYVAAP